MKKILMLLPLLAFLAGCTKQDDMSSPPATTATNSASTNAAPAQ